MMLFASEVVDTDVVKNRASSVKVHAKRETDDPKLSYILKNLKDNMMS